MTITVSDIRGRAGQGGAISLGVKTFDSVVSGKLDVFFRPEQFFSGRKIACWLLREHGCDP